MTLSLSIPFFGYNSSASTEKNEPVSDDYKIDLEKKLAEADQLFLVNKYDDVIRLLEEYKVILVNLISYVYCLLLILFYFNIKLNFK